MPWRPRLGALLATLLVGVRAAAAAPELAPSASPGAAAAPDSVAVAGGAAVPGAAPADSAHGVADTLALRLVPTQTIGAAEAGHGALAEPSGVATDAFGRVYVTDAAQHRLVRFDPAGTWLGEAGSLGSDPGNLRRPAGVTPVGSLGVAVLDRENRRLVLYDLFGRLSGVLTDFTALEDQIGRVDPVALTADRGGALYVADAERDRVLVLDFTGNFVRALGGYGAGAGSFRGLAGLAAGPHGELVTAERAGARLQWLDAGGAPFEAWPLAVPAGRAPLAVAVDDSSRVAVADESGGTLWLFGPAGRLLAVQAGLASPRALAFARDGSLLVAEGGAGRVRRFAIRPARASAPPGR